LARLAEVGADLDDIASLLKEGWREQVVAAGACLFHPDRSACCELLWKAFDSGSWASPQLGMCAMLLDPGDFAQVKRRLLLRCPVTSQHLEGSDPMWRHVVHGSAAIESHSSKAMAALLEGYARVPSGREWLLHHLSFEEAYWALEVDFWDQGEDIARGWCNGVAPILADMKWPVPDWIRTENPKNLLTLWDISTQSPVVRGLSKGDWSARIHRFFQAFVKAGHSHLLLEGNDQWMRVWGRSILENQLLLEVKGPYYDALWARLEFETRGGSLFEFENQEPAALKVEISERGISVQCLAEVERRPNFQISASPLQDCSARIWVVGISSSERFDGGVSAAIAQIGGDELMQTLESGLAEHGREPGQVILASSMALRGRKVMEVAFVITRPQPPKETLLRSLESVLDYAKDRYGSLAMPALGCGAAGFSAQELAGPLLEMVARYRKQIDIILSLPRDTDRSVFQKAAQSQGLPA
jgi:O-acetyl-ADP-ribose deacetylase (regulator of RNase III)